MKRFFDKIKKVGSCWNWSGPPTNNGYGQFWHNKKYKLAHRYSYEFHKGEIPFGLQIDHICKNRICVNPDHLEAVTAQVNSFRKNENKTHCKNGHEFDYFYTNKRGNPARGCKRCRREAQQKNYYA